MDTIKNDIQELKILFDTSPKLYEKTDFQKLIHILEHLAEGGSGQPDINPNPTIKDHPQFRKDIQNAVTKKIKKGKIKFTPDGYAICDKASSQNCNFFTGERIWLNSKTKWQKNLVINASDHSDVIWNQEFIHNNMGSDYDNHIVLFYIDASGNWNIKDYGQFEKVFTYRLNSKYLAGKKQKVIIEKKLSYSMMPDRNMGFLKALKSENIVYDSGELNKGVRIYIKCSQIQCSKNISFWENKKHLNRFKYYRYGTLSSRKKGAKSKWNWSKEGKPRSTFNSLIAYLKNVNVGANKRFYRSQYGSSYIDCIIDHYQFKKGITYRYKFRVYRVYKEDLVGNHFENFRQVILLK